jgi:putative oxygen-independent coproporphyrinogen III oxidase
MDRWQGGQLTLSGMLGLYLHIPFCSSICNYCNFNRGLFDAAVKDQYVRALEQEILTAADGSPADTIYFGGGTPSLLDPAEIRRLIDACRRAFAVTADAEVTLETNPETSSAERMEKFRAAGVNRVSFGVQSFRDLELQRLGRIHSSSRARAAVGEARDAGIDNVSVDLMMWLPQQSTADWDESIAQLVDLRPAHVSMYLLELYPNAPLKEDMARGGWSLAPEDDAAEMYLSSLATLDAQGYEQYEISNTALPGCVSRHNLKYWSDGAWLGFGCGAHSTRGGVRWKNVSATADYIARIRAGQSVATERRELTASERVEETLFTGLRLTGGVDLAVVGRTYGVDAWARFGAALQPFVDAGVLLRDAGRVRLTREGMLVANEVMQIFV